MIVIKKNQIPLDFEMNRKKILFITGTRADFCKLKSLLIKLSNNEKFDVLIFATGMHQLKKYDYTYLEIEKSNLKNIFNFINQNENDSMDSVLAKTITGLSDYVKEYMPDMIVVHGDRIEALAAATVGCLNNILVSHIEGGEVSGTVDEMLRHSISKLSHLHFVSNRDAKNRLMQMGEMDNSIFVVGSPEVDLINSANLPSVEEVKKYYDISFDQFSVVLFHPVTTEYDQIALNAKDLVEAILEDSGNYIVIHPNNDLGSDIILNEYKKLKNSSRFKLLTSMRFEYYISILKKSDFLIGNSSSGVRETPIMGTPSINIGSRQHKRSSAETIINCDPNKESIKSAIQDVSKLNLSNSSNFGEGNSADKFESILNKKTLWSLSTQKYFVDLE